MQAHLSGGTLISLPPCPPVPTESSLCSVQRAGDPPRHSSIRNAEESRKPSYFETAQKKKRRWLLQKSALVFNGYVIWLISYHVCHTLSSNSKSTKFRGKKKEIIIAKDEQISQEALILKRENRNREWWAFPLRALRNWGSREGRSRGSPGLWDLPTCAGPGCHGAILLVGKVSSAFSFCHSSCLVGSSKKEEKLLFVF